MRNFTIRSGAKNDAASLFSLIQELAIYEKKKLSGVKLTPEKIIADAFSETPRFHVLIAEHNNQPIGYVLYFFTYSATIGARILYLEDLLVREPYRKEGAGKQLMSMLAKIANENSCCRVEWHVFTWNTSACTFYKSLDATQKKDLVQMRLEKSEMDKLILHDENSNTAYRSKL
ncbi:MAG: hypothetical protein A3F11_07180 [Gammaproteobacteria bacterium RIFCSPHIGHO2_12_FULL_37_14]|nr:MAG: hypothetical protein A3F11_07180 [Gammaproteobacteria bacterium RIFCSPHIGHO2_12_FULL_37_14]